MQTEKQQGSSLGLNKPNYILFNLNLSKAQTKFSTAFAQQVRKFTDCLHAITTVKWQEKKYILAQNLQHKTDSEEKFTITNTSCQNVWNWPDLIPLLNQQGD